MQKQEIEITILPGGKVEYTVKGVAGAACEDISAILEKLGTVEQAERTQDYYAKETDTDVHIYAG